MNKEFKKIFSWSLTFRAPILLLATAFVFNMFFFFYISDDSFYSGMLKTNAEIAYNVWKNNALLYSAERTNAVGLLEQKSKRRIHYSEVDHSKFSDSRDVYQGIVHTPWYGILLGLFWKITHSLSYNDIIFLQLIFLSLCSVLVYQIALIFFKNTIIAGWCTLCQMCFFPLFYLNSYPMRDVWVYYGLLIMCWGVVRYLYTTGSLVHVLLCSLFFSWCQLLRPPLFSSCISIIFILLGAIFFRAFPFRKLVYSIGIMIVTNVIGFWLPFVSYNYSVHKRWFVSTMGQTCLEGLGELPNTWGYQVNDEWYAQFMKERFNLIAGTVECDDKAKELFFNAVREEPWFYIKVLLKRLPNLLLPGLVWFAYVSNFEYASLKEKMSALFYSKHAFVDFFGRQVYIRLYLLLGYIGLMLLLSHRLYFIFALLCFGIIFSCGWLWFVHLEHKYLIPYYAFHSFSVGYAVATFFSYIKFRFKTFISIVSN